MNKYLIAAIDVGSHAIRMKIGELDHQGVFRELESFRKVLSLGHDTFTIGALRHETVEQLCDLLSVFKSTMNDYGIQIYQAVATSALREASNKDYVVDQIKLKTDIDLHVISNSEEQYLAHKGIQNDLEDYKKIIEEGAVIVVVGAGTIQVTTYKGGLLTSSQNIPIGALRVKEALSMIEQSSLKYQQALEAYLDAHLNGLDYFKLTDTYQHFIAVGGESAMVQQMIRIQDGLQTDVACLSKERFLELLKQVSAMHVDHIKKTYQVDQGRASIIVPSMMIFKKFLDFSKTDAMIIPHTSLVNGMIQGLYETVYHHDNEESQLSEILTNAKLIGQKFHIDVQHAEAVERHCMQLFDATFSLHGMDYRERTLLRIAALLHDIGKYIGIGGHDQHAYYMIRAMDIFGVSDEEMHMIAYVARYHDGLLPGQQDSHYKELGQNMRVKISKMVAILRLADALDSSHSQKLTISSVKIKDKKVKVKCDTQKEATLEVWSFNQKADFFKSVFGIGPEVKINIIF